MFGKFTDKNTAFSHSNETVGYVGFLGASA